MKEDTILCGCPKCGKTLRVPSNMLGKRIVCKGCQTHFPVQAMPAAAAPAGAAPAKAPAAASGPATAAPATPAATPPPAAAPPPADELAPIPFDDAIPLTSDASAPVDQTVSTRIQKLEKVKIESTGPYLVAKIFLAGKSVNVETERVLNEHAAEGWELRQLFAVGEYAYAVMYRSPSDGRPAEPKH